MREQMAKPGLVFVTQENQARLDDAVKERMVEEKMPTCVHRWSTDDVSSSEYKCVDCGEALSEKVADDGKSTI